MVYSTGCPETRGNPASALPLPNGEWQAVHAATFFLRMPPRYIFSPNSRSSGDAYPIRPGSAA